MKIRIQDNSLRLRLTLREVEAFAREGLVSRAMQVVASDGLGPRLGYELRHDASRAESAVELQPGLIRVVMCDADRAELLKPDVEGAYVRHEWMGADGAAHRFMVMVEKDRPGSTCVKKEEWIYEARPGGVVETRPIPGRQQP